MLVECIWKRYSKTYEQGKLTLQLAILSDPFLRGIDVVSGNC